MTAKKAQTSTMILLVVPLGFSMGTELLNTMPHSSHTDLPMVKVGPPGSGGERGMEGRREGQVVESLRGHVGLKCCVWMDGIMGN